MLSPEKSYSLDEESDDEGSDSGSDSGSASTCAFPFLFEESVDCVDESVSRLCGVGSDFFSPI